MGSFSQDRLAKIASRFRERIQARSGPDHKAEEGHKNAWQERVDRYEQFQESLAVDEKHEGDAVLFDEEGIRVSLSQIELGKYTFVLKHLAATRRIEKIPSRKECRISLALTLTALLALIVYIFIGQLKFGLAAVVYLSLGLIAFLVSVAVCNQMKPSYSLEFRNASGETVYTLNRRDRGFILRLEAAVKEAVRRHTSTS